MNGFGRKLPGSVAIPFFNITLSDEQGLPQITHLPALLVWGGGDFALCKSHELPRLQELFPNHQTLVLDRARHFFQEDAPDQVASAIRDRMEARSEQA